MLPSCTGWCINNTVFCFFKGSAPKLINCDKQPDICHSKFTCNPLFMTAQHAPSMFWPSVKHELFNSFMYMASISHLLPDSPRRTPTACPSPSSCPLHSTQSAHNESSSTCCAAHKVHTKSHHHTKDTQWANTNPMHNTQSAHNESSQTLCTTHKVHTMSHHKPYAQNTVGQTRHTQW